VCTCLLVGGDRPGQKIGAAHLRHIPLGAIIASAASFWSGDERREEIGAAILRQMARDTFHAKSAVGYGRGPARPRRDDRLVVAAQDAVWSSQMWCRSVSLCPRGDLNPHALSRALAPQASASTYSATRTCGCSSRGAHEL
jgi:hypothetical protein